MGEGTDEIKSSDELMAVPDDTSSPVSVQKGDQTQDVVELRRNIEETREDLSQTIDALQERLDPNAIKQKVTDATIGKAEELAHTATEKIQAVAGPAADKAKAATSVAKDKGAPLIKLIKRYPLPSVLAALAFILLVSRWIASRSNTVTVDEIYLDD
ncbi:MAG: DUF3618 domain-containing protein [Abitibacteriaceae bacterium]|nr:DUF3618 domain-containing protein [Abditibacteriaceae bacterium]MBV9868607.1 DUF3618 domain-containing protein [Abditibacteriaceae bacterium]